MRPLPPSDNDFGFQPDQDGLGAWVRDEIIDADGSLYNPEHGHLEDASIGWLWTSEPATHRGRIILGEARLVQPPQERWGSAMAHRQIRDWFGHAPDFIIILSATWALQMDDASFCALVEHELYHCAQAKNEFGEPRFRRDGGAMFEMRGHDIEEFVGVVERYGSVAAGVERLVDAAIAGPTIARASIDAACGTCHLKIAA